VLRHLEQRGLRGRAGRRREPRARLEQVGLEAFDLAPEFVLPAWERRRQRTQRRVELVEIAVGLDARVALGHAFPAEETRAASIPRAGVDAHG
jgi:hypothetical protein